MPAAEPADPTVDQARALGEVVNGHPEHLEQVLPHLVAMLTTGDPAVVAAAVDALGHAWHPVVVTAVLEHVRPDHGDARVHLALARALPAGIDEDSGELRGRAVDALVTLSADTDARVRDWAAFGLGQLRADSPPVRQALAALLDDPDPDARCEALVALAGLGDQRALAALVQRLESGGDLWLLELQAAAALGAPQLHPGLQALAARWAGERDDFTDALALALARCAPGAASLAGQVEREVVEQVRALAGQGARVELAGRYPRTTVTITGHRDADGELDLALWAERERPDDYRVQDVVGAVGAALAGHER